jgi:hypothetical protein
MNDLFDDVRWTLVKGQIMPKGVGLSEFQSSSGVWKDIGDNGGYSPSATASS